MIELLFVDTSVWFAFVNKRDPEHASTHRLFDAFPGRLVTSNYVFDETVTLCSKRLGHETAVRVGEILLDPDVVELVSASRADERGAWELFRSRGDKTYSYTDCVSFTIMSRLGIGKAAALDEDFQREGFEVLP